VGKSKLFCRYVKDKAPAGYNPTIGVDYANKSITTPGSAPLGLQIWVMLTQRR
jgi:GTPase SAR1 family protein